VIKRWEKEEKKDKTARGFELRNEKGGLGKRKAQWRRKAPQGKKKFAHRTITEKKTRGGQSGRELRAKANKKVPKRRGRCRKIPFTLFQSRSRECHDGATERRIRRNQIPSPGALGGPFKNNTPQKNSPLCKGGQQESEGVINAQRQAGVEAISYEEKNTTGGEKTQVSRNGGGQNICGTPWGRLGHFPALRGSGKRRFKTRSREKKGYVNKRVIRGKQSTFKKCFRREQGKGKSAYYIEGVINCATE